MLCASRWGIILHRCAFTGTTSRNNENYVGVWSTAHTVLSPGSAGLVDSQMKHAITRSTFGAHSGVLAEHHNNTGLQTKHVIRGSRTCLLRARTRACRFPRSTNPRPSSNLALPSGSSNDTRSSCSNPTSRSTRAYPCSRCSQWVSHGVRECGRWPYRLNEHMQSKDGTQRPHGAMYAVHMRRQIPFHFQFDDLASLFCQRMHTGGAKGGLAHESTCHGH